MHVDYYMVPNSPWTYLGHERLAKIAAETGATIAIKPMDLGKIFPLSGGLPLPKRAPQRQAYRLVELARFRDHLGMPLNIHPAFFPVPADAASALIVAANQNGGTAAAMKLAGALLRAVWAEERNIADADTLAALVQACGLPPELVKAASSDAVQAEYHANTEAAIALGVFGAPTFVINGEMFWGQDRLEFVERALKQGA